MTSCAIYIEATRKHVRGKCLHLPLQRHPRSSFWSHHNSLIYRDTAAVPYGRCNAGDDLRARGHIVSNDIDASNIQRDVSTLHAPASGSEPAKPSGEHACDGAAYRSPPAHKSITVCVYDVDNALYGEFEFEFSCGDSVCTPPRMPALCRPLVFRRC
jgi:hypothetical protein